MKPELNGMPPKKGKGHGLLLAIGMAKAKPKMPKFGESMPGGAKDEMAGDEPEHDDPGMDEEEGPPSSEPGHGDGDEDDAVGMALDDVVDALGVEGDKREELKDALKRLFDAHEGAKSEPEGGDMPPEGEV
jgi:hypothetical protein